MSTGVVEAAPTVQPSELAQLRPGENLGFLEDFLGWYRVTLGDGRTGYVSKAWTGILPETVAAESAGPTYTVHFNYERIPD